MPKNTWCISSGVRPKIGSELSIWKSIDFFLKPNEEVSVSGLMIHFLGLLKIY